MAILENSLFPQFFVQICAFREFYFKDYWNLLDLLIVFLSVIDIVIDEAAEGATEGFSSNILKVSRVFRVLRMSRVLRLLKVRVQKQSCSYQGRSQGVPGVPEPPSHTSILHYVNFQSDLTAILITDQTAFGDPLRNADYAPNCY